MIDLTGKRAFVTGGGRGIGRATAVMLAQAGAKVAVGYRSRKPAADRHVTASVRGDLGTPAGASKAVAEALRALGGLDILVINHGVWPADDVPVAKITDEQWESTRRANLDAVIYVCRAAIPNITEGGTIVLVSSTAGQRGEAFHADYVARRRAGAQGHAQLRGAGVGRHGDVGKAVRRGRPCRDRENDSAAAGRERRRYRRADSISQLTLGPAHHWRSPERQRRLRPLWLSFTSLRKS